MPHNSTEHKIKTTEFFASHPIFSLNEAVQAFVPPGGRPGTVERLKHHLEKGRLKLATRGVYAVVPADRFHPSTGGMHEPM